MISLHPQFIKDDTGKKLVILPETEFNSILEELEDLEDVRLYDEANKGELEFIDADQAFREIEESRKINV